MCRLDELHSLGIRCCSTDIVWLRGSLFTGYGSFELGGRFAVMIDGSKSLTVQKPTLVSRATSEELSMDSIPCTSSRE